ncbi:hypothetical protein DPM19_34160 [Actinomadura craniellae]|uniref:Uncharacterized protein n=1 Tax=Actinomadura craniellae TaxID=2231787 RepID=A0A365GV79_9ACTN|nr:hypothetical protein [Actinomadura craniellae]RAY10700.1 hypothetical protein DPM19_34160 [Actinomadura craniellae]
MSGWNPPPGQGGPPYGPQGPGPQPGYGPPQQPGYGPPQPGYGVPQPGGYGPQPPYPPRRRSSAPLVIGLLGGGLVLVVVLVLVVALAAAGGKEYTMSTPSVAGSLRLDTSSSSTTSAAAARGQLQSTFNRVDQVVSAVYTDGTTRFLFLGATGDMGDPDDLLSNLRRAPSPAGSGVSIAWFETYAGGNEGEAACGMATSTVSSSVRVTTCAWQTESSFGQIVTMPSVTTLNSPRPPYISTSALGSIMRQMRPYVETEK